MVFQLKGKILLSGKVLVLIFGLVLAGAVLFINHMLYDHAASFLGSYAKAEIIYPNISLGMEPPRNLTIPSEEHPPLWRLMLFGFYNFLYFFKISLFKLTLFFANVKPYFSFFHNLMIVLVLYPLYLLAVFGFFKTSWSAEKVFISIFVLSQAGIVAFTSENWDGRFLIPVLPFIFIFSAVGVWRLWRRRLWWSGEEG